MTLLGGKGTEYYCIIHRKRMIKGETEKGCSVDGGAIKNWTRISYTCIVPHCNCGVIISDEESIEDIESDDYGG